MSMITTALAQFDECEQAIATVQEYGSFTVAADGIGKVSEARKQIKRLRIDVEKRRKELNEGALTYQRAINSKAKELTAAIEPIEDRLQKEEDAYESEKRRLKEIEEKIKRVKLQNRLNTLGDAGVVVTDIAAVEAMDDATFEFHLLKESGKAEQARRQAEEARKEAEAKAEQQRKEAEELAAKIAADRAALEAERAELRRQQEAVQQAQAEERRREEQRLRTEAEEKRKAEAEAREAKAKPELEKLEMVFQAMQRAGYDVMKKVGGSWWNAEAAKQWQRFADSMRAYISNGGES